MLTITVKPFPKIRNGQMVFVGVVTRNHSKAIATTLLHPTIGACRESAALLIRAIEMSSNRSGLGGYI